MTTIRKPEWFFYPAWIILTALCIPLAFFLYFVIIRITMMFVGDVIYVNGVRHITEDYLMRYVFFPMVSLLTGVFQYGLLRRYLPRMGWWVLATVGGWLLGFILIFGWPRAVAYFGLAEVMNHFWAIDPAFVVLGLSVGVGQWLLLRRRLPRAGWWIAANVLGWGLVLPITGGSLDQFDLLVLGMLPACVMAVTFALLMNQAPPPEPTVDGPSRGGCLTPPLGTQLAGHEAAPYVPHSGAAGLRQDYSPVRDTGPTAQTPR